MSPRKPSSKPMPETEPTTSDLVRIVTDLDEATEALPESERREYEEAQQSVVEARFQAEMHEGYVRIL